MIKDKDSSSTTDHDQEEQSGTHVGAGTYLTTPPPAPPHDDTPNPRKPASTHGTHRIEGLMFIPHSPGGGLAKCIQKMEDKFADVNKLARVRVIERGGQTQRYAGKERPMGTNQVWESWVHDV